MNFFKSFVKMQILGGLSGDIQPSWVNQGSTLSPLFMAPPPPPPTPFQQTTTTKSTTSSPLQIHSSYSTTVSPTLLRLCHLWPFIHTAPAPRLPDVCNNLPTFLIDHRNDVFRNSPFHYGHGQGGSSSRNGAGTGERGVGVHPLQDELTFSGRSFSLMGVLGGVLFILLVIAFITCIRHRKRVRTEADGELDLDVISSRIRRIHQARAGHHLLSVLSSMPEIPHAPPPDYASVLKQREKEESDLPSYLEAIRESEELHGDRVRENDQPHSCFIPANSDQPHSCFIPANSLRAADNSNATNEEINSPPYNQIPLAQVHAAPGKSIKDTVCNNPGPSQLQQNGQQEPDQHSELIQQPQTNIVHV